MHGIDKYKAFPDAALPQAFFDLAGDVDKATPGRHLKPEFLPVTLHAFHHIKPAGKAQGPKLRRAICLRYPLTICGYNIFMYAIRKTVRQNAIRAVQSIDLSELIQAMPPRRTTSRGFYLPDHDFVSNNTARRNQQLTCYCRGTRSELEIATVAAPEFYCLILIKHGP